MNDYLQPKNPLATAIPCEAGEKFIYFAKKGTGLDSHVPLCDFIGMWVSSLFKVIISYHKIPYIESFNVNEKSIINSIIY